MVLISKLDEAKRGAASNHFHIDTSLFRVDGAFAFDSAVVGVALVAIFSAWW